MWALLLRLLPTVLGWFGLGAKDERHQERDAGEALGKAETGQASAMGELRDIKAASDARAAVRDDVGSLLNDPANKGPAKP